MLVCGIGMVVVFIVVCIFYNMFKKVVFIFKSNEFLEFFLKNDGIFYKGVVCYIGMSVLGMRVFENGCF